MFLTKYKGERTLTDLIRRLYKIKGKKAKLLTQQAEAALLRANPHLGDLQTVPEGTVIVVPEIADLEFAEQAQPAGGIPAEVLTGVRQALGHVRPALVARAGRLAEEASKTLELANSRELKALARRSPVVKDRLSKITETAEARLKQAENLETFYQKTLAGLEEDFDEFIRRLT